MEINKPNAESDVVAVSCGEEDIPQPTSPKGNITCGENSDEEKKEKNKWLQAGICNSQEWQVSIWFALSYVGKDY